MDSTHHRYGVVLKPLLAVVFVCSLGGTVQAQGPCGGKPCPIVRIETHRHVPHRPRPHYPGKKPPADSAPECEDAELVVVCGMPGCEITLNGKDRNVTDDLGGITFQVEGNQKYKVRVTKPGYDSYEKMEEMLACGDQREVKASLPAKPVALRIRTIPAACDIYLDGQKQPSGSDAEGLFSYVLSRPTLLVEARRKGFLSATRNIFLRPELANQETVLQLDPISAVLRLTANVASAQVTIDNQRSAKPISDRILMSPGPHTLAIEALGYAPVKLELTVAPDETISREVQLERLAVPLLLQQAAVALNERRYGDTQKLGEFVFATDPGNPTAHRLVGQVYVERNDFGNAGSHFAQALAGDEPVTLRIRRHAGEKFDLNKGHDACEARLVLSKNEVEFQGVRVATDNFKVAYDQVQVVGIQLKNNAAPYLGTKVTANGKRRDFNFYSYDNELTQAAKAYLQMLQGLLRPH